MNEFNNTIPQEIDEYELLKNLNKDHCLIKHLLNPGDIIFNKYENTMFIKGKENIFMIYDGSRDNHICIPYSISQYSDDILKKYNKLICQYREMDFSFSIFMLHNDKYIIENYGIMNPDYIYVYISDDLSGDPDCLRVYNKNSFIELNDQDYIEDIYIGCERAAKYLVNVT